MARDLYEILGVSRGTDREEIRKKYKKLARQYHPDVNPGDPDAEKKFKEINAAYAVLSDEKKRRLYDEYGELAMQAGFDEERPKKVRSGGFVPPGDAEEWVESHGFPGGFEDLFGDLFSGLGGRGRRRGPAPGEDIEAEVELDFLTAIRGGSTRLAMERPVVCKDCGGTGSADRRRQTCGRCRGTGRAPVGRGGLRFETACPDCGGTGSVVAHPCEGCHGRGQVLGRETVSVTVPAGVRDGQRLRLAGLGAPGEHGAPAGDLYVRIRVAPHPVFKREGDDLHVEVPVTVGEAVAGATIAFPTPSGEVKLKIPPHTRSGQRFRLRGMGAPSRKGKGDLFARVVVQVPDRDGGELAELARRIDRHYSGDVRSEIRL